MQRWADAADSNAAACDRLTDDSGGQAAHDRSEQNDSTNRRCSRACITSAAWEPNLFPREASSPRASSIRLNEKDELRLERFRSPADARIMSYAGSRSKARMPAFVYLSEMPSDFLQEKPVFYRS